MENDTEKRAGAAETVGTAAPKLKKKSVVLKTLLLAAILLAVFAVWLVKNSSSDRTEAVAAEGENADFALEADSIDLPALLSYQLPIVIDFGSDSCVPCQQMAPVLKSANADYQGKAIVKFIDVWKNTDAANGFPIQVIPTQVFINADGTPYTPSKDLGVEFTFYSSRDTQEHLFTVHQGGLTQDQLAAILADMGASK